MSKNLFIVTLFMLAALILVACGTQPTPTAEPASSSAEVSSVQSSAQLSAAASSEASVSSVASESSSASISSEAASASGTVSFSKDILPLLQKRCVNCHGGQRTEAALRLNSYDGLMAGSENGAVIVPGDPANSPFVDLVQRQKMPKRGTKLTPDEVKLFSDWVAQGAANN